MLRTTLIAAALAAVSLPAVAATSVTVNLAGLDAKAAHATIVHAAKTACQIELRDSSLFQWYYLRKDCVDTAVARAESKLETDKVAVADQSHLGGR